MTNSITTCSDTLLVPLLEIYVQVIHFHIITLERHGIIRRYGFFRRQAIFLASWRGQYNDVIMGAMASQITSLTIVYSIVYSGAHQRKHQSSASLAFVRGIHRSPVNSPHKGPVMLKMFPFDDVIMFSHGSGFRLKLYCLFVRRFQRYLLRVKN